MNLLHPPIHERMHSPVTACWMEALYAACCAAPNWSVEKPLKVTTKSMVGAATSWVPAAAPLLHSHPHAAFRVDWKRWAC